MNFIEVIKAIHEMFLIHGDESYGEDMTVLSHSLQAADIALSQHLSDELIIASLLHDIGHVLPKFYKEEAKNMEEYGTLLHEVIAKEFLLNNGFSLAVAEPIYLHVDAKRYLCSVNPDYYNTLSNASQATMKYQGGLMNDGELLKFESNVYSKDAIKLRHVDDLAKETNYDTSTEKLNFWMQRLNEYLN